MWEEEYYIFDSETISEEEVDEKIEYDGYRAFEDSMQGDEVVRKLNDQAEQIENGLCPMCGARISKCGGLKNNRK
jgi:hypothetical protein